MKPALVAAITVVAVGALVLAGVLLIRGAGESGAPRSASPSVDGPVLFSEIDQAAWRVDLIAVGVDAALIDFDPLYRDVLARCRQGRTALASALATAGTPDSGIGAGDVLRVNFAHVCPSRLAVLDAALGRK